MRSTLGCWRFHIQLPMVDHARKPEPRACRSRPRPRAAPPGLGDDSRSCPCARASSAVRALVDLWRPGGVVPRASEDVLPGPPLAERVAWVRGVGRPANV